MSNWSGEATTEAAGGVVVYSTTAVTFALVSCVVLILVGVGGNLLTVAAVLLSPKLRAAPTSVFILSLSATDLIFCVFNLPIQAVRWAHQSWVLGSALCTLFPFLFYLNVAASLFNMCAVTLNRYVLIAHYTHYDKVYRGWSIALMIAFCWAFPIALLAPTLAGAWGTFGYRPATFSCTILRSADGSSPKKFFFLLGFFLPVAVIVACYARIACIVRRSQRTLGNARSGAKEGRGEGLTLTKMVLVIFATFLLCYLPLMLANVLDERDRFPDLHVLASLLAYAASVLNPAIYGLMSTRYRDAYRNVFAVLLRRPRRRDFASGTQVTSSSGGLRHSTIGLNSVRLGAQR